MASAVDYVNRALLRLGAEPIAALSYDDSPTAATCVDLYPATRDELLGEWDWRFATARVQLPRLTTTPANTDYQYEYALPADTLRVVRTDMDRGRWVLYRDPNAGYRRLYSNEESVSIDVVQDSDPALYPPHFQAALVAKLAAVLALPVTRRSDFAQLMAVQAEAAISQAKTQDFNEEPWSELEDGGILADARFGG